MAKRVINNPGAARRKLVLGLPANLPLILDDTPSREVRRERVLEAV